MGELQSCKEIICKRSQTRMSVIKIKKYSKILLLRPSLVLPKSGLISRAVLIVNVENSSRYGAFFQPKSTDIFLISPQ